MGFVRLSCVAMVAATIGLTGCAGTKPPSPSAQAAQADSSAAEPAAQAFVQPGNLVIDAPVISGGSKLAGRTLHVGSIGDIKLNHKEVILTFDDGPIGGRTDSILTTLDRFGVKATFLMVGQQAQSRPALARKVASRGHAVGSHTYGHPNLARMSHARAVAEIEKGERVLREAGLNPAFFRFPYLADTKALRSHLARRGVIVLDVDIDSKDYFKVGPSAVAERTMRTLRSKGRGIILMHDLHARTASMLPGLLRQMEREGYKVVNLQPTRGALVASAR